MRGSVWFKALFGLGTSVGRASGGMDVAEASVGGGGEWGCGKASGSCCCCCRFGFGFTSGWGTGPYCMLGVGPGGFGMGGFGMEHRAGGFFWRWILTLITVLFLRYWGIVVVGEGVVVDGMGVVKWGKGGLGLAGGGG